MSPIDSLAIALPASGIILAGLGLILSAFVAASAIPFPRARR